MAVPAVFSLYGRQFDGEAALQKKLGSGEEWRIQVVGVRLAAAGRRGNRGEATVTYDKVVRQTDRSLPDVTTRHVASIVYEYQPKVFAQEKDRLENAVHKAVCEDGRALRPLQKRIAKDWVSLYRALVLGPPGRSLTSTRSRRSWVRRSPAFARATSGRRRARSPAPAARRSIASAPALRSAAPTTAQRHRS